MVTVDLHRLVLRKIYEATGREEKWVLELINLTHHLHHERLLVSQIQHDCVLCRTTCCVTRDCKLDKLHELIVLFWDLSFP